MARGKDQLKLNSYRWIRKGKGDISPDSVSLKEKEIARIVEAEFLTAYGHFPDGFYLTPSPEPGVFAIPRKPLKGD